MPAHKAFEGQLSSRFTESISDERIRLFCQAVGAEPSSVAPPTFLSRFRDGEFEFFEKMGLKLSNILHGEQQYSYSSPIRVGDEVTFQTRLASVLEKKGGSGKMSFLVFETKIEAIQPTPRKIGVSKTTVIVREAGREKK